MNDQIFTKFKKLFLSHFWFIFPIFGAKNIFPENLGQSRTTSYGFLPQRQNLEKTNNTFPRKCQDRQKDGGRTEGRTDPIL